ncbi:C-X-C motif chemokine 10-like [Micropterus salmoides]|uniref:C-X-C motif chemokine 10-like n=1 Tax=Micropterus salmoides TaxID=27706 RepID=UPI0018EDBC74|nr:C-X-C motif chemokine 10-like [Micropterus salmoides]XP_038566166.1 C-X-C motif chemokine 10-like [Micropterus salmoides]XP_038566167.1 C-X-C motif chemokine 10-like [Micropterus salmoides]XP_038566168.1 C-X-C motif chemokine 10-like [Micropterus salmoides]
MSSIMKVFLLLASMVYISKAQLGESGQQCLCQRVRNQIASKSDVKDIQIYPATVFCDTVEIVVTLNSGLRYCLNPKLNAMKRLLANVIKQKTPTTSTTARPTELSSTARSTSTARI